ncbi:hypothetical protein Zm00014a_037010 [Zea mays]|uniref:Uncharacterized protein n=1 Tax=Zea mays TaxID=4577 RepID=A0A3L6DP10_MAIZE|nr:hypothetical protein Zm00014a_037010 [Zea mays]
MDGYSNLALSPPTPTPTPTASGAPRAARPSMELTNTKETKAWEGLAIGAVTLARTFSTGSHRFCRSGSERRSRSRSGLLRRAFSMRRHPAGLLGAGDGYWRIHDMDGDSDRGGGGGTVVEEHGEGEEGDEDEAAAAEEEVEKNKKTEQRDEDAAAGKGKEEAAAERRDKKRRGGIFKACKKLFRL